VTCPRQNRARDHLTGQPLIQDRTVFIFSFRKTQLGPNQPDTFDQLSRLAIDRSRGPVRLLTATLTSVMSGADEDRLNPEKQRAERGSIPFCPLIIPSGSGAGLSAITPFRHDLVEGCISAWWRAGDLRWRATEARCRHGLHDVCDLVEDLACFRMRINSCFVRGKNGRHTGVFISGQALLSCWAGKLSRSISSPFISSA